MQNQTSDRLQMRSAACPQDYNAKAITGSLPAGFFELRDHERFGRAWHHRAAQNHCVKAILPAHGCPDFRDHTFYLS